MTASWSRFTLMDGLVLIVAFALGMGLATHFMGTDTAFGRLDPGVVWAVSSVLWAGMVAGPLILTVQRFRGRRPAPSLGEWLWLVPLAFYLPSYAFAQLAVPSLALVFLWVWVQCLLSLAAAVCLVAGVFGMRPGPACRWTDLVGCSVCTAFGPAILFALNEALSQL
jgi:hypothetical protein